MDRVLSSLPIFLRIIVVIVGFFLFSAAFFIALFGVLYLVAYLVTTLLHWVGPDRDVKRHIFGKIARKYWWQGRGG